MHRCPRVLRVAAIAAALVAARAGASDCYTLTLRDSWGDGWNGAEWVFQANETFSEGTLDSGLVEEVSLCVASAPTCFAFEVRPGSYDSEISWDFDLVDVEGGAAPFARTEYWLLADGRVIESACDEEPLRPSAAPTYARADALRRADGVAAAVSGADGRRHARPVVRPPPGPRRRRGLRFLRQRDGRRLLRRPGVDYPYACRDWVGYDCANAAEDWNASVAEDWNAEDVAALLAACPRSCGTCNAFAYDPGGAPSTRGAVVVFDEAVRVAATSVVVRGSNASVALAGGATRLFEVTSGGALRLENLALRGGAPSLGGGGAGDYFVFANSRNATDPRSRVAVANLDVDAMVVWDYQVPNAFIYGADRMPTGNVPSLYWPTTMTDDVAWRAAVIEVARPVDGGQPASALDLEVYGTTGDATRYGNDPTLEEVVGWAADSVEKFFDEPFAPSASRAARVSG
ncbi:GDP-fucose protein O-fucosyltransferase [Aureococcus anophagefferens]|nr:GDP-fucose protein O-fucosyltransferase [Aureococcus anophagefferens]